MMSFCLALAACATAAPAPSRGPNATPAPPAASSDEHQRGEDAADRWKNRASVAACRDALVALARGQLATFRLGSCGRVDAERAFGSSGDQPSRFEKFGEYRVYSFEGNSIIVWFLADNIRVMQLLYPKLPEIGRAHV